MKKLFVVIFFLTAALSFTQQNSSAVQKYALVIGNGSYKNITKLNNPVNDANDMADALKELGFNVDKLINASLDQMDNAAIKLKNRLSVSKNSYGFLFYAGHGVQSDGENYLIPVDANIPDKSFLRSRAVSVNAMMEMLNEAGNTLNVIVLDACRDNPFSWNRGTSRGLQIAGNQPANSIIVYATAAGSVAADGTGRNGVFTSQLLKNLKTPGLEVYEVFRRTMGDVSSTTNNQQRPAIYTQFSGIAYLGTQPAPTQQPTTTQQPVYNGPRFTGHKSGVYSVCFSPDGKYVLSGSYDKTMKLWDAFTGQEIRTFKGHKGCVNSVCFSSDGKYALSGSGDKTLKLWDIATGREIKTFPGHKGLFNEVTSVCFSPDGKYALSGSWDYTLKLWDVLSSKEIRTFTGHTSFVYSVCFSPDGKYALSGAQDNTLKLWDVATGQEIRTFTGHWNSVNSVCFSPDGKYALSGATDRSIKLWNVATGMTINTLTWHSGAVNSVCFSPDGKYVLSGSSDNTLKLWDIATGYEIRTFTGHTSTVTSVCFSPDGKYALSGSDDCTLKLWDVATGKEIK